MIVYYGSITRGQIRENVFSEKLDLLSNHLEESFDIEKNAKSFDKCPSFQNYIRNVYLIRSPYDYSIGWNKESKSFSTTQYDQFFFNENTIVRDVNTGLISYTPTNFIFFTENNLELELTSPWFHNTLNRHVVIPGVFNIGQHFRTIECAIQFMYSDVIKIKEGDPLFYVKFLTNEKIQFKRFFVNDKLKELQQFFLRKRNFTKRILPLKWYYENSIRKTILKEIKNNLME